MKTVISMGLGVFTAIVISPFFMVNEAQASRTITYGNGATWSVDRNGGGNVSKTFDGVHGNTYNFTRTCASGSCSSTRTYTK